MGAVTMEWSLAAGRVVATVIRETLGVVELSYVAGLLAGTTDVGAITLSMANQAKAGLVGPPVAATTIMLGAASNTIVKAGLVIGLGGWAFGRRVALALAIVLAAGGGGLAAMWMI